MGFLIKFFLFFTAAYMLMKAFAGFLSGKRNKQTPPPRQHAAQSKQPETQEKRIIEYQKKTFASSDAEDVDFVEIKEQESREN